MLDNKNQPSINVSEKLYKELIECNTEEDKCNEYLLSVKNHKNSEMRSSNIFSDLFISILTRHDLKNIEKRKDEILAQILGELDKKDLLEIRRLAIKYDIEPEKAAEFYLLYGDCINLPQIISLNKAPQRKKH